MEEKKRWVLALIAFFLVTVYTAHPAWPWENNVIDEGPVIGLLSLAVDESDQIYIVYNNALSHEVKIATHATGSWVTASADPPLQDYAAAAAVDSDHRLHVADYSAEGITYLTNSSGSWTEAVIGPGTEPSIAVDASGHVHLCYISSHLSYATNRSGDWVTEELVDTYFLYTLRTSIAVDSAGHAYVRYGSYMDFPGDFFESYATNASGSWVETSLPLSPLELLTFEPSIAIDSADHLHVCYMAGHVLDFIGFHLGYGTNATGKMRSSIVVSMGYNWPTGTAMATDSTNAVHIAYSYSGQPPSNLLEYATNAQGGWSVSGPLTDQIGGQPPLVGVDTSGRVYISYIDADNRLLVISGEGEDLSPSWPGTPAEASAYGQTSRVSSSLFNHLAFLLLPIGAVILLRVLRRRK
jgi:hypothetical protein